MANHGDRQIAQALREALALRLRRLPIPVIGRIDRGRLLLDLRCLEDEPAFLAQLDALPR